MTLTYTCYVSIGSNTYSIKLPMRDAGYSKGHCDMYTIAAALLCQTWAKLRLLYV